MRDVQRTTLASNGNAKPSVTIFDALPIPPPSQRSKVTHPTEMQKNTSSVGWSTPPICVESQVVKCLFVSLCNICLYPRQKLGSLRGGLAQKKKSLDNSSFAKRPEHRQKHLVFDNIENNDKTWKSKGGRTNATWLQKVAVADQWLSPCHTEPYRRILWCRSQAIHALQLLGPHAVSHGRIGVRTQHRLLPPACCLKPPALPQVSGDG